MGENSFIGKKITEPGATAGHRSWVARPIAL
jgi:hypothetical protein